MGLAPFCHFTALRILAVIGIEPAPSLNLSVDVEEKSRQVADILKILQQEVNEVYCTGYTGRLNMSRALEGDPYRPP
ncbi:MAG: hypothetical protein C7B43_09695 [Sulfobacillus benefaciens]|uniref:Uncharacterized protein n=1 Tax=Sulfobacillus benefaciens TaxID=453960 RepID=A0A2T2X2H1_9FIRM|nr:MAG: hypothetical protein C7B43_09695 [Sulfobacillus benefaciens]